MKIIVGLTLAFMLLISMAGIGTWAYFSDVETSAGNQMTAGTLDLKTDDEDGVTKTLSATNMKPGDTVGPETITLKNTGSVAGASLDLSFIYIESDGSPNPTNMTADATAAMLGVTTLNYGGSSILPALPAGDTNGNGWIDMQDIAGTDLSGQSGIAASPASKDFEIAVQLRTETGNDFQADGVTITMTFTLNQ